MECRSSGNAPDDRRSDAPGRPRSPGRESSGRRLPGLGFSLEKSAPGTRGGSAARQTPSRPSPSPDGGPETASGGDSPARGPSGRIPHGFVDPSPGRPGDPAGVWGVIPSGSGLVSAPGDGMEPPEAPATGPGAGRSGHPNLARPEGGRGENEIGLTQLAGREPHIWRVIAQNAPYMAVGMTQLGPNCVTPMKKSPGRTAGRSCLETRGAIGCSHWFAGHGRRKGRPPCRPVGIGATGSPGWPGSVFPLCGIGLVCSFRFINRTYVLML